MHGDGNAGAESLSGVIDFDPSELHQARQCARQDLIDRAADFLL